MQKKVIQNTGQSGKSEQIMANYTLEELKSFDFNSPIELLFTVKLIDDTESTIKDIIYHHTSDYTHTNWIGFNYSFTVTHPAGFVKIKNENTLETRRVKIIGIEIEPYEFVIKTNMRFNPKTIYNKSRKIWKSIDKRETVSPENYLERYNNTYESIAKYTEEHKLIEIEKRKREYSKKIIRKIE